MDSRRRQKAGVALSGMILAIFTMAAGKGKLVIEDPDLTAWMLVNNTYMRPSGADPIIWAEKYQWDGVLVQIGDYDGLQGMFDSVVLKSPRSPDKVLKRGDFVWINVQSDNPDRANDPLDQQHVGMLLPDPSYKGDCDALNACAEKPCLCSTAPCDAGDLEKIHRPCLRMRSLHGYFTPIALITYWLGPRGYDLQSEVPQKGHHLVQTFKFKDEVRVTVYDGKTVKTEKANVILVKAKPKSSADPNVRPHGGFHSPPWEP